MEGPGTGELGLKKNGSVLVVSMSPGPGDFLFAKHTHEMIIMIGQIMYCM